jgi:uncharacterized protein (TIGR02466 family)
LPGATQFGSTLIVSYKNFFPTVVYQNSLGGTQSTALNKELLRECYIYRDLDEEGSKWSKKNYVGGYTSYASMNDLFDRSPTFAELRKRIDKHVRDYAKQLQMDLGTGKLVMSTCWINIMPARVTHSLHLHPLSVVSGTYYVSTPKGTSALKFEDPRLSKFMAAPARIEKAREENQRYVNLQPKAGQLILFESWLRHEVPPNPTKEDRVSISFNYEWQ